jgi:hypothetical protein
MVAAECDEMTLPAVVKTAFDAGFSAITTRD